MQWINSFCLVHSIWHSSEEIGMDDFIVCTLRVLYDTEHYKNCQNQVITKLYVLALKVCVFSMIAIHPHLALSC